MNCTLITPDKRRSKRVRVATTVRFQIGRELGGHAELLDVDHDGMSLRTSDALKPGQLIMLEVDEPKHGNGSVELKGKVVWCANDESGYRAGIRVYHDEHDSRLALGALMCAALKKQAAIADLRTRHFIYVEWKLEALAANESGAQGIWKKRKADRTPSTRPALALGF